MRAFQPSKNLLLSAAELADAFVEQMHPGDYPDEVERVRGVVLLAARHLADSGYPGDWAAFAGDAFFADVSFLDRHELVAYALILIGLFGWLANLEVLDAAEALSIIAAVAEFAPADELVAALLSTASQQLDCALAS